MSDERPDGDPAPRTPPSAEVEGREQEDLEPEGLAPEGAEPRAVESRASESGSSDEAPLVAKRLPSAASFFGEPRPPRHSAHVDSPVSAPSGMPHEEPESEPAMTAESAPAPTSADAPEAVAPQAVEQPKAAVEPAQASEEPDRVDDGPTSEQTDPVEDAQPPAPPAAIAEPTFAVPPAVDRPVSPAAPHPMALDLSALQGGEDLVSPPSAEQPPAQTEAPRAWHLGDDAPSIDTAALPLHDGQGETPTAAFGSVFGEAPALPQSGPEGAPSFTELISVSADQVPPTAEPASFNWSDLPAPQTTEVTLPGVGHETETVAASPPGPDVAPEPEREPEPAPMPAVSSTPEPEASVPAAADSAPSAVPTFDSQGDVEPASPPIDDPLATQAMPTVWSLDDDEPASPAATTVWSLDDETPTPQDATHGQDATAVPHETASPALDPSPPTDPFVALFGDAVVEAAVVEPEPEPEPAPEPAPEQEPDQAAPAAEAEAEYEGTGESEDEFAGSWADAPRAPIPPALDDPEFVAPVVSDAPAVAFEPPVVGADTASDADTDIADLPTVSFALPSSTQSAARETASERTAAPEAETPEPAGAEPLEEKSPAPTAAFFEPEPDEPEPLEPAPVETPIPSDEAPTSRFSPPVGSYRGASSRPATPIDASKAPAAWVAAAAGAAPTQVATPEQYVSSSVSAPAPTRERASGGGFRDWPQNRRTLLFVAIGVVFVLVLIALFFGGQALRGHSSSAAPAPVVPTSTTSQSASASATPTAPAASPAPAPTTASGPAAVGTHPWTALQGGECLGSFTNAWQQTYQVVDCATGHPAQMVAKGTVPDATYPGVTALAAQIAPLCQASSVVNFGAAAAYTDIQVSESYPATQSQWDAGDHSYYCFVSRSSGQAITGSLKQGS